MSTSQPVYDQPSSSTFPSGGGPGEGDVLVGWKLKPLGVAFVMGKCTHVYLQSRNLLLSLQHPPGILSVPWPIPSALLSPPGSHFPPAPLDGDGEDQAECEMWELAEGKIWIDSTGKIAALWCEYRSMSSQAKIRRSLCDYLRIVHKA